MPTIVLLDVSLSMARPITLQDSGDSFTRLQLAINGINALLDYFNVYSKLEFVSLLTYSAVCEVLCPFTRDFEAIKQKLQSLEEQDKTCIEPALHAVNRHVLNEWGSSTPCHIIIVTDGNCGASESFRNLFDRTVGHHRPPLPFAFPGKLSALIIAGSNEPQLAYNLQNFKRLADLAGGEGNIHTPEGTLSLLSVQNMVRRMAEVEFVSYQGTLRSGCLSAKVTLSPHPLPYTQVKDFETQTFTISDQIEVIGFLDMTDIGSPAAVSRHLVLPLGGSGLSNGISHSESKVEDSDEETHDEGKSASFCVLLHGALRVENMAALCTVADQWFGILFSWADNKKKSNLMLTVLEPGSDSIPWLGDLELLGSAEDAAMFLGKQGDSEDVAALPSFPVRPAEKRSYSQSTVAWIRQSGLHSDIQKILRSARKLPEKTQHFYKELNRVRKAAIQVGFLELLEGLANIFERECTALPDKAHPDCALQLTHCARLLRQRDAREIKFLITPLRTTFQGDD